MIGYLIRRVIQAVIVVLGVCLIVFVLNRLIPGGALAQGRAILGPRASIAAINLWIQQNGLNKPVWTQFAILIGHVFTLNLGYSYKLNEPVATIIAQKLPKTVLLLGLAVLVTVIVAIPLGIFRSCGATSLRTTCSRPFRLFSMRRRRSSSASSSFSCLPSTGTSSPRRRRKPPASAPSSLTGRRL